MKFVLKTWTPARRLRAPDGYLEALNGDQALGNRVHAKQQLFEGDGADENGLAVLIEDHRRGALQSFESPTASPTSFSITCPLAMRKR